MLIPSGGKHPTGLSGRVHGLFTAQTHLSRATAGVSESVGGKADAARSRDNRRRHKQRQPSATMSSAVMFR